MKYLLYFSLKLERQNSNIIYNSEGFADNPIEISVPDVTNIFKQFIGSFEDVGVIDKPPTINSLSKQKKNTIDPSVDKPSSFPQGIDCEVRICKLEDLDRQVLESFCNQLSDYFKECCSRISAETFLSEKIGTHISGIQEVIDLRNYLIRYTKKNKKNEYKYKNGYLYISIS